MKTKTRETLLNFANAVELLAQGTINMIGVDNRTQIMQAAEDLKFALDTEPVEK